MSYPEAIYHGDSGEVSARLRPNDTPADLVYPNGTTVDYLSTGASTEGHFGLYRWNMAPGPGRPRPALPPHDQRDVLHPLRHDHPGRRREDRAGKPGDHLYVPPGGLHSFKNDTDEPASMLLLFSPGAPREGYFEGLVELAEGKKMTEEELSAFFVAHDNIYV